MPTLILSPRYTPDSQLLWQAALQNGWHVERLHSHMPPSHLRDNAPVLYGEGLFVRVVAERLSLALIEAPFDWMVSLPSRYVQRSVAYMQLSEARKLTQQAFVKPAGDKSFEAKVYQSGSELPDIEDLPVLVSEPVIWENEYRLYILDRTIATMSIYKQNGELTYVAENRAELEEAASFANSVLHYPEINMPPAFVLDIGIIRDRGWAVIEANPAWASGVYGCDGFQVLNVLKRTCIKYEDVRDADKAWILSPFA